MTDTTPSPTPITIEDDDNLNDLSSTDYQETISQRRSSCKPSYLKGAHMDGGDAATSGDRPENDDVSTSKRPLSATIGDSIIGEGESKPDEGVEIKQLLENGTTSYGTERLEEPGEELRFLQEENEIKDLVRLVLQKVRMELILEKIRQLDLTEDSYECSLDYSECQGNTDEDTGFDAVERKELDDVSFPLQNERPKEEDVNRPDIDEFEMETESRQEAEQQLDELIRFVIEKQSRDLAFEKEEANSSCIHETGVERDKATEGDKHESGLDFKFHSVMRRLTCERIDNCWEDEIDNVDGMAEVADKSQCLEMQHGVSEAHGGVTEHPQENKKEANQPLHHIGSELTMEETRVPQTTHEVQELHDEVQGSLHEVQGPHDEVQGPHDEVQGSHDEVQGSHDEVQGSLDKIQERHDFIQEVRYEEVSYDKVEEARDEMTRKKVQSNHSKEAEFCIQEANRNEFQDEEQESIDEDNYCLPPHGTDAMGASEVPNDARGVASKEDEENIREVVFDGGQMNGDEQEDGSSGEDVGGEDDEDLLSSEDEEELDTMVGFVINSARSSLMNNFDIFTFNKLPDFKGNTSPPREDKEKKEVLESGTNKEGEMESLTSSGDGNSGREPSAVSLVSASDDTSKTRNQKKSQQDVGSVDDEGGVAKNEDTEDVGNEKNKTQFDRESLAANLTVSSTQTMHVTTDSQSQDATETLLRAAKGDWLGEEKVSRSLDITSTVIGPEVALTASEIVSDSDDYDDDFYESETKPAVCINTAEDDWECLAIQQISKSQSHAWYPTYNTAHHGVGETVSKQDEIAGNLDGDESTLTKPSKIPSNEKTTLSQSSSMPGTTRTANNTLSSHNQRAKPSAPVVVSSQVRQARTSSIETDSGVAVINDGLRKKILHLEQRLKELALELTFLGDRNWRLEAYIDCLIKTLEVLEVTDVVDLDEKTLPLYLFKVKVKAGYKLGSYNCIPSRALWSYNKEGRQPPYVDLSGWGDTDRPVKRPDSTGYTPVPSCDDDVGLSVSQMYQYESQLEELSTQNQILEAQLREAQELAQAFIDQTPGVEQTIPQSLQQQPQLKDQGVQTAPPPHETVPQDLEVLQQQMQEMQEYHPGGEEYWRHSQQQQQLFTTATPSSQQPEGYVVHQGKQYLFPLPPQHIPPMQNHILPQQHHYQQFLHYQSELQPQQQLQQLQQQQPNWNNQAIHEDTVLPSDWDSSEELSLQDPLEWPTLTESQAQNAGHPQPRLGTEPGQNQQQQWLQSRPFANTGRASQVSQSAPAVSFGTNKDKSTLHSSLVQPASTGSIPNHENRHKVSHHLENKSKEASGGSASCQSLQRGRQFDGNSRNSSRYNHRSLDHSRSGFDTVPRGQRQEEPMRFDYWDPPLDHLPLSIPGELPVSLHGEVWHHESPPFHNNIRSSSGPSHNPPPAHHSRNMDRNRRFFHGDSVLDSYRPDFSGFHKDAFFSGDVISESVSASNPTFKVDPGYKFDKLSSPPSTRGLSSPSSSTTVGGYSSRHHDKRAATPTRRGKPWHRAGLPRHSSSHSPLKSHANPERTHNDSK